MESAAVSDSKIDFYLLTMQESVKIENVRRELEADQERLHTLIQSMEADLTNIRGEKDELGQKFQQKTQEFDEREITIAAQVIEKDERITQLEGHIQTLTSSVEDANSKLHAWDQWRLQTEATHTQALAQLQRELLEATQAHTEALSAKDDGLSAKDDDIRQREESLAQQSKALEEKENLVARLQEQLAARDLEAQNREEEFRTVLAQKDAELQQRDESLHTAETLRQKALDDLAAAGMQGKLMHDHSVPDREAIENNTSVTTELEAKVKQLDEQIVQKDKEHQDAIQQQYTAWTEHLEKEKLAVQALIIICLMPCSSGM